MALLICLSSLVKSAPPGPDVIGFDKVVHFFVFGLVGTLIFRGLRFGLLEWKRFWTSLLAVALLGTLDEVLQHFNPQRYSDVLDWVADVSGAALALLLYRGWPLYRRVLEFPLWGRLAKSDGVSSNGPS